MKHYYYTTADSDKRGSNIKVRVWELDRSTGDFNFVGLSHEHTTSWKGAKAVASFVLQRDRGHKLDDRGYYLLSKNIKLHNVEL